jgi:glycosyltransferase involved in cell wall biosynthesis
LLVPMVSKKRVLWLIKGFGVGGAERLLTASIPYLNRDTFDYKVAYFLTDKDELVPEFKRASIPVFCLNINKSYDLSAIFRIARFLRQQRIEILHIHSPHAGVLGRIAAHLSGVKAVIYTEHMPLEKQNRRARLGNLLTYYLNDATIAVSKAVLHSILDRQIVKHGIYTTIYNGIDLNAIATTEMNQMSIRQSLGIPLHHRIVGNVANLFPWKGHEHLLEAARLVLNQYPDVTFVIVGKANRKEDLKRLQETVRYLKIKDRVIFAGFRQDVFQVMSTFDIFALPSLWEGFGIALLEAMALGKPVVGTNVGGIPEVIDDGLNGFLVESRNPQRLAGRILELLGDETLRNRMGQNGKQKVQDKFSIQQNIKAIEQLYITTMNGKRGM